MTGWYGRRQWPPRFRLDRLIAFTDYNKLRIDGRVRDVMEFDDIAAKWRAFSWQVQRIDGHSFRAFIIEAVSAAEEAAGPSMVVLDKVKGKGSWFAEEGVEGHNIPVGPVRRGKALTALKEREELYG